MRLNSINYITFFILAWCTKIIAHVDNQVVIGYERGEVLTLKKTNILSGDIVSNKDL